jgi:hypothetical protein
MFKASKLHHSSEKNVTKLSVLVLPDLWNPKKLTALKSDDQSSQKWFAKVLSSTASLQTYGFGLENI